MNHTTTDKMKLVFATHNQNKFKEIKNLLPKHIELLSLTDIACHEDIAETAETIEGNARIKAEYVFENYGYDCFADDTGLEVEALNGAPGVYSARYAGDQKNSADNIKKLMDELESKTDRSAKFKTVIAYKTKEDYQEFTGICSGKIINQMKGSGGFGYDPVFEPQGKDLTFAEMTVEEKSKISHRARAFRQLAAHLQQ